MSEKPRAVILRFHVRGPAYYTRDTLIKIEGVDSPGKAAQFIGKNVVWKSKKGKLFKGRIIKTHGCKGVLVARFNKPLPGEALSTTVELL